jgi:hypothetical protein
VRVVVKTKVDAALVVSVSRGVCCMLQCPSLLDSSTSVLARRQLEKTRREGGAAQETLGRVSGDQARNEIDRTAVRGGEESGMMDWCGQSWDNISGKARPRALENGNKRQAALTKCAAPPGGTALQVLCLE